MRGPPSASVSIARSAARRRVIAAPTTNTTPVAYRARIDASVTASTGGVSSTTQSNGPVRNSATSACMAGEDSSSDGFSGGVPAGRIHRLGAGSRTTACVSGVASGMFVICANGWMNAPAGFDWVDGKAINIDPVAAMFNRAALQQGLHMTIAAFCATGFAVAGIHAFMLRRDPQNRFHKAAIAIALLVGGVTAILQPLSGDLLAKSVAKTQPVKLAAFEGQFQTEAGAPFRVGGIPDESAGVTRYAIEIPYALSILAYGDPNATVKGLNDFPADHRPPVEIVHVSFQIMVACGVAMMLVALWSAFQYVKKRKTKTWLESKWFLRLLVTAAPLGFIAIETGWVVTEVGRQPWIIQGVMRTSEAVTPMPGLVVPFITFTLLYILLAIVTVWLLLRQVAASPKDPETDRKEVRLAA